MFAEFSTIPGSCGVGNISDYEDSKMYWNRDIMGINPGGCNWLFASFIEGDDNCKRVYEELSSKYKIVFQSPVRVNRNSGNKFFFCIFDGGEEGKYGFDDRDGIDDEDDDD